MLPKGFSRKRFGKRRVANRSTASLLLVIFVVVVALYSFQTEDEGQAGGLDRELVALLPPSATSLTGADILRLKTTPVFRFLEEESRKNEGPRGRVKTIVEKTGFDPLQDLDRVLVASWVDAPNDESSAPTARFLVVARGRFDLTEIGHQLDDAEVEQYRGVTVYHQPVPQPSGSIPEAPDSEFLKQLEDGFSLAFFDERTAVAGVKPAVMKTIDRKMDGGASLLDNIQLLERAEALNQSNQLWSVSLNTGELWESGAGNLPSGINIPAFRIFRSMESSSLAADLTDGIDVKAEGVCATPEDAKTLADAGRGMVALGRLTLSDKYPEAMKLFDAIDVVDDQKVIRASVKMTAADFETLLAALKEERDSRSD